jgi:EmrB/QacA subfamily drug resistance transporter
MFMAQLDSSVVLVALPQMAHSFGVRPVDLSIGVTIYILAQALVLPSSSWVADRFGARGVFAGALGAFTLASVLCAGSHTLGEFVAARILQGVAAALMTPIARIVLLQSTAKEDLIGVMTISTVPMLVAPTLGPPVGGFIVTYLSWPWIFLLNLPVGIAGVALVLRFIPAPPPVPRRPFDLAGFFLLAAATGSALVGLQQLSLSTPVWTLGGLLIAVGCVIGVLAVRQLERTDHPVLSLASARVHTFYATTLGGGTLVRLPAAALPFVLPLLFQVVLGYSALYSGLLLLAVNGGDLLLKLVTTRTIRRFGFRAALVVSAGLMSAAIIACALVAPLTGYWVSFAMLAGSGMARSLLFTAMSTLAFADVPHEELTSSSVLWNLVQQIMTALGVSLAAVIVNLSARVALEPAGHVSALSCQVALVVMSVLGAGAMVSFARLHPDAGARLAGREVRGGTA